ncbi:UNVERIFIED_ORG: acyl-CoA synthetase (AMP-forming)/AMP-acid ligase II [Nocardia globerula]|uniref:Acyl-CoA synthetase (AMP-forming)/AMP-acid ligase II n=1 Tax=Nocardia globerula TaxID=1818 RepID=A0A652YSR7_NOCGL|nr:class I adenylate-forming enzyme family protein [Rhodococcus globerulus]NMD61326.1 acyl--CoA ligase [Nocardia globerula]PVX67122.1 acyl-CoA synthetase (AMP-forming)/AMP-acid ligase II [Rhodococcus globerulus]
MSISLILEMAASGNPDRTAISVDDASLTYQEFADLVAGAGSALIESGAKSVVFLGGSGLELPTLLFAAAYAGIPFTPVNYRLSSTALHNLINRVEGALVVVDGEYVATVGASSAPVITTDDFFVKARALVEQPASASDVDPDAPAIVLFTSGTTSEPKGVVLRHSHLLSYVMSTVDYGSAEESDGALISVPPYHVAGMGTILTNIYAGRRMIYLPHFDAQRWTEVARSQGATSAMVVPTMLDLIVDHLEGAGADIPTLKSLSYGGARMPRPTLEAALRAFPNVGFVNAYGLTETSSTIALLGPDDHRNAIESDDPTVKARLGSIGLPVPGIEIEIRDCNDKPVNTGEQGELWVRGAQVSGEYMGSGSVLDANGWFPTRDLAYLDNEGFIFVVGRNDDTIIRGGENIAPAEIEDVLIHHPHVRSVAVVGIPDTRWGQAIVATVVLEPGEVPDPEALREYVRAQLRGSRTPDRIVFRSELPSTLTGKILRRDIIADVLASLEQTTV